jgi:hypothetical protein
MLAGGLDLVDMIEIAGDFLRTLVAVIERENHVVGDQLTRCHHPGLVRKHHALAQIDLDAERILLPVPGLGELAADRIGWNPGVGIERVLAAEPF